MLRKIGYISLITVIIATFNGCASTGGLSAGQLPTEGKFVANNGVNFDVVQLDATNVPISTTVTTKPVSLPLNSMHTDSTHNYTIAIGDIIDIKLPYYPEITPLTSSNNNPLSDGFLVNQSGYIQFPMVGQVKAVGLTTTQLSNVLASKLTKYLKQPDPQVRVISYRGNKFYIDGEVHTPGQFTIADQPVSLYSAIGMAGGTSTGADVDNITLTRNGQVYNLGLNSLQKMGYSANNLMIKNGDTIHVGNRALKVVNVVGEFGKSTPVAIPEDGLSLATVIGNVGGVNNVTANAKKVYVLRSNPATNHGTIYRIDFTTLTNFAVANQFKMQPGDVVYADPTGLARWNRILTLLLPSAATSAATTLSVQ